MNLFKQAYLYTKYLLNSKTLHGTHSPFVYSFLEDVVYQKLKYGEFENIEKRRLDLINDTRSIIIKDFGAGSEKNDGKSKRISKIALSSLKPAKYAELYFRIIKWQQPANIIEIGTSLGITTSYLASATTNEVISMEGCPNTLIIAKETFKTLGKNNIKTIEGNFDLEFPKLIESLTTVDWVYFDGNHRKKATLDYFELALKKCNEQSIFIFDDIYWSEEMMEAWEIIKAHPKVVITLDMYFIGIVFFKPGQAKENFTIKY